MTTITLSGYVHTRRDFNGEREFTFERWEDWNECGYVLVGPTSFEYELPAEFNPVAAEVAALEAEKAKVTAEFTKTLAKINERLANLSAIEFTPNEA